jgi:cytosine/adenosine deaminase-related metal-dependent hydrolase
MRASRLLGAGLTMLLVACARPQTPPAASGAPATSTLAFVDVAVVPMDSERVLAHQVVLVAGDRIAAWGPLGTLELPATARRIDARGKYLLPGLVDMHVHVDEPSDFALYLYKGFTTVRNMEGAPYHLRWREEIAAGRMLAPTLLTTGPFTNQPGIQTPEDARRAVLEQKAAGYDEIKVHGSLQRDAYDALTATARQVRMRVVGHAPRNLPFSAPLEDGQAELAHVEELIYTYFHYDVSEAAAAHIPDVVADIRRAGMTVTPTLVTYDRIVRQVADLDGLLADPATRYVRPYELATWQRENNRYLRNSGPGRLETLAARFRFQQRLVLALHAAGVRLMLGSDAVGPVWIPGWAGHEELVNFVGLGMTPYEALSTATRNPAAYWGQPKEFGLIAAGARADLLLLDANPLADVRNTERIAGVMVRGRWLPRADLEQRLAAVARANEDERAQVRAITGRGLAAAAEHRCAHRGKPLESDAQKLLDLYVLTALARMIDEQGLDAARALADTTLARCPGAVLLSEPKINAAADRLLAAGRRAEAIRVLEFNASSFPHSFLAPYWLAEAYLAAGDTAKAIAGYQRSLAIDPGMEDAKERLRQLGRYSP